MKSFRRFSPASAALRATAALVAATLLIPSVSTADNGNGKGQGGGHDNGNANGNGHGNSGAKDKVKNTRGLERAAAVAETLAAETGRNADLYLTYAAGLDQTLSEFTDGQIEKIVEGE